MKENCTGTSRHRNVSPSDGTNVGHGQHSRSSQPTPPTHITPKRSQTPRRLFISLGSLQILLAGGAITQGILQLTSLPNLFVVQYVM
jgi:hypothetical protein